MKLVKNMTLLAALMIIFSGCVAPLLTTPAVIGAGAGGGGVYSAKTDSVEDTFNINKDRAFESMIDVIKKENGIITKSSLYDGRIEGELISSKIYVFIKAVNESQITIKIEARKTFDLLPDQKTAIRLHRLFVKEVTN